MDRMRMVMHTSGKAGYGLVKPNPVGMNRYSNGQTTTVCLAVLCFIVIAVIWGVLIYRERINAVPGSLAN